MKLLNKKETREMESYLVTPEGEKSYLDWIEKKHPRELAESIRYVEHLKAMNC